MNELTKRVLVAVIGIPITVAIIWFGNIIFFIFLLLVSNFVLFEFYNLSSRKNIQPYTFFGIILSTLQLTFYYLLLNNFINFNKLRLLTLLSVIIVFSPTFFLLFQVWNKKPDTLIDAAYTLLGIYWVTFSFAAIISVRFLPEFSRFIKQFGEIDKLDLVLNVPFEIDNVWAGKFFIVTLGTIWLCDTFAYFFGLKFGKHKLAAKISPKKTWEGAFAGYVGALISFFILDFAFSLNLPYGYQFLFGSIVGIIGQVGDLAESKIKREFYVKDSSNILPGHGGFLDRMDSIMFVYPTTFLLLIFLMVF